eukprot:1640485-Rhodomonas_salina.5
MEKKNGKQKKEKKKKKRKKKKKTRSKKETERANLAQDVVLGVEVQRRHRPSRPQPAVNFLHPMSDVKSHMSDVIRCVSAGNLVYLSTKHFVPLWSASVQDIWYLRMMPQYRHLVSEYRGFRNAKCHLSSGHLAPQNQTFGTAIRYHSTGHLVPQYQASGTSVPDTG